MAGIIGRLGWAVVALTGALVGATAADAASRYMQTGAITSQPIGHYEFCETHVSECNIHSTNTLPARITDYGRNVIREVNDKVNTDITPETDQDLYGRDEVWAYPTDAGDCEDYVLLKRRDLIERGFSPADLLITVVRKPDGEGHAVLTVRATDGDYILDNLDNDVKLWSDTPYRYLKRQAANDTGRWVTIENSDDVLVGAVSK
jgi:predicted transglutaminase-like cysteine proteinase